MKFKSLIIGILSITIICLNSTNAFASISVGGIGVSKYKTLGNCVHGDRQGDELVSNFLDIMTSSAGATKKFQDFDFDATKSNIYIDFLLANFDIFAGHGFYIGLHGVPHNSLHLFATDILHNVHKTESDPNANFFTTDAKWGSMISAAKWVTTFSCNFLNTNDPDWYSMMNGVHSVCGYGTVMYLNPRLGADYARNLVVGQTVKEAFFNANMVYEPQNDHPVICRVLAADISQDDTIRSYSKTPLPIASDLEKYSYWDLTVQPK